MTGTARAARTMALAGLLVGLGGCDWWPPTLQQRIGEQEAHIQTLQAEKARMQRQVADLTKEADEVKAQAAQLQQANGDLKAQGDQLTFQVDQLKAALEEAEAKLKKGKRK